MICLALGAPLFAQSAEPTIDNDFVQKQFGSNCSLVGVPSVKADFDGDGIEDIAIPARCTSPMMDQVDNRYLVVDPYNAFFGYGDPKITTAFASDNPDRRAFALLVIHGSGAEAWHSANPKAKFMIVNLPFKQIYAKKLIFRRKEHMAIYVEETGGDSVMSALFWDGKKYRYQPMGSSME